jgi:hypothetical protein
VEKYLCIVPKKYTKIALAMETLLDFEHLSIEEVTCRLKAVDDREEAPLCRVRHHQRQLLFTEEQYLARQKEKKKKKKKKGAQVHPRSVASTCGRRTMSAADVVARQAAMANARRTTTIHA